MTESTIHSLFDIRGKTAVVTGGTGVLGAAICNGLSYAGVNTVILGRNERNGEAIAQEIKDKGGEALFVKADVLDAQALLSARGIITKRYGAIDILINAAGGNVAGAVIPPNKTFFDLNLDDFSKAVDLNLTGTVLPCKVFCEEMAAKGKGIVINIASVTSFRPLTRVVGYSAAKSAVKNFTEWLAVEMVRKYGEGIRVNAIAPGFFLTEQNRGLLTNPDGSYSERGQSAINQTPVKRFGKPDELVGTVVWLCSDASRFVHGITVPVDGGFGAYSGV
jgi:NAD(P)-dependent dehydrogenase (short-subunit alcohol dehydrogenase family)